MSARHRAGALALAAVLAPAAPALAVEVAVLKTAAPVAWQAAVDALRRAARAHRVTEYELAADLDLAQQAVAGMRGRAAVLVAMGPGPVAAARAGLPDLPLVYGMVPDPASLGLLPAPPHVTGVAFEVPARNQLAAFRLVNPRAVRIGVLYTVAHTARHMEEAQRSASVLRLLVTPQAVESEKDLPGALRALFTGEDAVDALWLPPDPVLLAAEARRLIFAEALKAARAVYAFSDALVAEGALASNGPDFESIGQELASAVERLAAGERNIELRAPRAELVVNVRMAERLKIDIPEETLKTARRY